jgi:hypothetical protein
MLPPQCLAGWLAFCLTIDALSILGLQSLPTKGFDNQTLSI